MRDDYDWNYDDEGEDRRNDDFNLTPSEKRELLSRWRKADNVALAKQTEITLLELHIHEMVENDIRESSFSAAAADLEAQEILQRVSRIAK